jgi:hypothetical protein
MWNATQLPYELVSHNPSLLGETLTERQKPLN